MSVLKECFIDGNTTFLYLLHYGFPLFHRLQHSFISLVTAFLYFTGYSIPLNALFI